jgi:hypothetical protein
VGIDLYRAYGAFRLPDFAVGRKLHRDIGMGKELGAWKARASRKLVASRVSSSLASSVKDAGARKSTPAAGALSGRPFSRAREVRTQSARRGINFDELVRTNRVD